MTDFELIAYYVGLLILQYRQEPRARATIAAQVAPIIMNQLPLAAQDAFNVDTAIGAQLDVLGKYAGVTRNGFGFTGPVTLNDDDFRTLIRLAIISNSNGSSLSQIQDLLHRFFPNEIFVFDFANMHMGYMLDPSIGSQDFISLFIREGLLPKPMGVTLASVIYVPDIGKKYFGFRTYSLANDKASPFNSYTDYHTDRQWLSYSDAVVV